MTLKWRSGEAGQKSMSTAWRCLSFSRRAFLRGAGGLAGALVLARSFSVRAVVGSAAYRGVVCLFMDKPIVARSGTSAPYEACGVSKAAEPLMKLSEIERRMHQPYL
jgi:hypothetical protein